MSNYTMSPVVNGEKKQMIVKVGDTLPIGAIIGFDTTQTIPNGWEYYAENQIKKIAPVTPPNGLLENTYGTSQTNGYAQEYINSFTNYSTTTEQVVGKWTDGKTLYRKVVTGTTGTKNISNFINLISNVEYFEMENFLINTNGVLRPYMYYIDFFDSTTVRQSIDICTYNNGIAYRVMADSVASKPFIAVFKYTKKNV